MPFVAPLALLGLAFVPLIVAFYLLKLRRDETVVPSTLLWQRLVADVEANAPWQRLRRSLLLLLQILLAIALAILAARPFLERPAGLARDIVLVLDTSASMAATDIVPSRLDAARDAALAALDGLPAGGKVSVVAAGRTARVVINGTSDLGRVRQAIEEVDVEAAPGDLADALRLASALAARSGDAEVLVATDAALADVPDVRVDAPVRVLQVGRSARNQAIVALAVRTAPSGVTRSAFISLANFDLEPASRRVQLYGDGEPLEARDVFMDPQARVEISIDTIPLEVEVVEVRLDAPADAAQPNAPDDLAIDDRAWAVVPPSEQRQVLLVSNGDPYLETALSFLPDTELYGWDPDDWDELSGLDEFELVIFEGFLPAELPAKPILAIAPPRTSPLGEVSGTLREPGIGTLSPDEPVLRYVDLSTTHIAEARKLVLPEWARAVIPGPGGAPLLYTGTRAGLPSAVLAFEPRRSDLPLQVAFPVLLANLTGELLGGSGAPSDAVRPGTPITLTIPSGATGLSVSRPDGSVVELVPGTPGAASATFSQTELLGVYAVTPVGLSTEGGGSQASPAPSSPAAGASAPGSAVPSALPRPSDPSRPVRFAVDLFDPAESRIAPGAAGAISDLGRPATAPGAAVDRPPSRDELWVPIVVLALAFLMVEWAVYQRDALVRLRRALSARFPSVGAG